MTFLRVMAFSLVVLLSYTLFANILPQVQSDPPREETVDTATLDRAGQAAWGERLFRGKGTCTLCHNDLGRAPNLLKLDLGQSFKARLTDPRYRGAARDADGAAAVAAYIRESMLSPSAFVVAGFGKKGTNDRVSPMPKVDGAPISLSPDEIDAVIAFLQDKAGFEVTVSLPSEPVATAQPEADDGPATDPETVIDNMGCSACHDLLDTGADVGPSLAGLAKRKDRAAIRHAILDPNAEIAAGFEPDLMPQDYGDQLRAGEMELLLDYLQALPAKEGAE